MKRAIAASMKDEEKRKREAQEEDDLRKALQASILDNKSSSGIYVYSS
jgi:hypothetical protein